jgi:SAM-dependent methyltransferase
MEIQSKRDAFGAALVDCLHGKETHYIVERDDGFMDPGSLTQYFTEFPDWAPIEQRMPEFVRGPVLDVGCGAGRHALHLQGLGLEVMSIDKSPLALCAAGERGVKNTHVISLDELVAVQPQYLMNTFSSIIMMGHNIGLLHGWDEGRNILAGLARMTRPDARIVGTTRDPGKTDDRDHLAYQHWNRKRGRMPGQIRFRIRYRKIIGEWMDYLFLSAEELSAIVKGTGWMVETTIPGDCGFGGGGSYLAVLGKE